MTDSWRNRIVGHGEEQLDAILANPLNWRVHPREQQEALLGAIRDVGFIRSVTVNRTTGNLVDGHLRVILADREGVASIPVEYVELSEQEEAEALAVFDPIAALALTDADQLAELLTRIREDVDPAIADLIASTAEAAGSLGENDSRDVAARDAERGGAIRGIDYFTFSFGDYRGNVSRSTYDTFVARYKTLAGDRPDALLDDLLAELLATPARKPARAGAA